jgi:hypothetical protein
MDSAMIGMIRRRLKPADSDSWDANQPLGTEVEPQTELRTDTAVLLAAAQAAPGYSPGSGNLTDYYKGIMKTAIQNKGRYRDHWIPVPWLRMILAGLESRWVDPDMMWYEADFDAAGDSLSEVPEYNDLFPSERDALARLR